MISLGGVHAAAEPAGAGPQRTVEVQLRASHCHATALEGIAPLLRSLLRWLIICVRLLRAAARLRCCEMWIQATGDIRRDAVAAGLPRIVLEDSSARSREAVEPSFVDDRGELHAKLLVQDELGEAVAVDEVDGGRC